MEVSNEIVYKKIGEIKPYLRNPRNNQKTVQLLVKIIPKVGFNVPIVIDENNIIVKGHARYFAAIRLGMREVPCIISHADEDNIKLDRIADNMVAEFSEWLTDDLLDELKEMDVDFDMTELALPDFRAMDEDAAEPTQVQATQIAKMPDIPLDNTGAPVHNRVKGKFYRAVCPDCGKMSFVKIEDAVDVSINAEGES